MISKENYEIWMIDYLDGNLTEEDQKLFLQFLDQHPELKSELEDLDKTILCPDASISFDKADLFKTEADEIGIPYPDYVAIKELEEDLTGEEIQWKDSFIAENKNSHLFFEEYKKTIVKTVHHFFPNKNVLRRVQIIPFLTVTNFRKIGVAATIAVLLSIGSWSFLKQNQNHIETFAVNNTSVNSQNNDIIHENTEMNNGITSNDTISVESPAITNNSIANNMSTKNNRDLINTSLTKEIPVIKKDSMQRIAFTAPECIIHTEKINAYEVGLNTMMPILISNKLQTKQEEEIALKEYISKESQRLERQAWFITKSAKVLNFLSGNNTTVHKVVNEEGELIAYRVESENLSVSKKIKNVTVTN